MRVEGNRAFSKGEILDWLEMRPGAIFDTALVERDRETVLRRYRDAGYWLASVGRARVSVEGGEAEVALTVEEGRRVKVGTIALAGVRRFDEGAVRRRMDLRPGEPLSERTLEGDIERILTLYEENGHPFCAIRPTSVSVDEASGRVDLTLEVQEGPEVAIEGIRVVGNTLTQDRVIRRATGIRVGEVYDQRRVDRAYRRLMGLGFFERVEPPQIQYDPQSRRTVLVVTVEEGRASRFDGVMGYVPGGVGGGYFTGSVDLSFANLLGTGRGFTARWSRRDPESSDLYLGYREPWVWRWPVAAEGTFGQTQRRGYVQTALSVALELPLAEGLSGRAEFGRERVIPDSLGGFSLPDSRTWTAGARLSYDARDDRWNPSQGFLYGFAVKVGSKRNDPTAHFTPADRNVGTRRYDLDLEHYLPTFPRQVLALGLHGREVHSGEAILPPYEKLKLGGANTLRGYREEQFAGHRIAWVNGEYRHLLSRTSRVFAFVDVGYFADRRRGPQGGMEGVEAGKVGYGFGLRVESRLGLLGIDYGLGQGDAIRRGKVHVGLLNRF